MSSAVEIRMLDPFEQRRSQVLQELSSPERDKSVAGSVDARIQRLVDCMNQHQDLYTTSSCSGTALRALELPTYSAVCAYTGYRLQYTGYRLHITSTRPLVDAWSFISMLTARLAAPCLLGLPVARAAFTLSLTH